MSHEIAKTPVDPTQFPEAAHRFAQQALREHQRAEKNVIKAVEHAVRSGQTLLKAYDLCEWGQWEAFFQLHFPQHEEKRLSLRTARDYMNLARNWSRLCEKHPAGLSSQRQAMKALVAIVRADKSDPEAANSAARCRIGEDCHGERRDGPFRKKRDRKSVAAQVPSGAHRRRSSRKP